MSLRERFTIVVLSMLAAGFAVTGVAQADDPAFRSSPPTFDFGDVVLGQEYSGDYNYVELYPTSDAEVTVTSISIVGADAADFGFEDGGCIDTPIYPDWGCVIYIQFNPETVGHREASLQIESNATAGTKLIPISANAVEPATNAPTLTPGTESDALPDPGSDYVTYGMGTADFNGDGRADVVTNNTVRDSTPYTVQIGVAFGKSDGTLTEPVSYPAGQYSASNLVTGNFDGVDGPDIVSLAGDVAHVFLNDGEGEFVQADPVPVQAGDGFISPGDFNEDGDLDFTVTGNELMEIFLGDGNGGFEKAGEQEIGTDGDSAMGATTQIADFRGDGSNDVALTTWYGRVEIYLSDGDGSFTKGPVVKLGGCGCKDPWGISPDDVNGDGRDDLSVAIMYPSQVATLLAGPDGSMSISQMTSQPLSPDGYDTTPKMVGNGDLNGDGIPEMVAVGYNGDSMTVNPGLTSGTGYLFGDNISMPGVADSRYIYPSQVLVDDFDGDGSNDVIVGSESGKSVLFRNEGQPEQVADPVSLDFGDIIEGTSSNPETVELSNPDGLAPLDVSQVEIAGGSSGDFQIDSEDCTDAPVLVGHSCTAEVVFAPGIPLGEKTSELQFTTNKAGENLVAVPLTGDGVDSTPTARVAPTSLAFGEVTVGASPAKKSLDLINDGNVPVDTGAVTVEGAAADDYAATGGCTDKVLAPEESCTVEVAFSPTATGSRSAAAKIASNAGAFSVAIAGTGVAAPEPGISVQPTSLAFGETLVGSESTAKSAVITSSGTAPLVLGAIGKGGTNPGDFPTASNGCSGTLQPGSTCSISIKFKPTTPGSRTASVTISSNAPGGMVTVPLSGTATRKPLPAPRVIIKKKPRKKYLIRTRKLKKVKIAFRSNQSGSKFKCRIDRKKFRKCKSPKVFRRIKPGKHAIRVRATKAGKTGPAKVLKFRVVRKKR